MANPFQQAGKWLAREIAEVLSPEAIDAMTKRQQYYEGVQKSPLNVKPGQADDNLITNFIGLAVDRANAMMLSGGVQFTVPAGKDSPEYAYLGELWEKNHKQITLQRWGADGELFGTAYLEIVPDGITYNDKTYPRIVVLKPSLMAIECDELDADRVEKYIWQCKVSDNKVITKVVRRAYNDDVKMADDVMMTVPEGNWVIEIWETSGNNNNPVLKSATPWLYDFPPIVHNQNLPSIHSVYGVSGLGGAIDIQDKYNQITSNLLKIVRYHAHPKTWGRGFPANSQTEKASWGADEMIKFSSETAELQNLEMQSDLSSSRAIQRDLRQTLFDVTRTVDIASLQDKLGNLTNFGLRILYGDALAKNAMRRLLYGEALEEINRRLLIMAELPPENDVIWGSDMPADTKEDAMLIMQDLSAAIISKQTAAEKRGYTWKDETSDDGEVTPGEESKIAGEKQAGTNVANNALLGLFTGRNVP